MEIGPESSCFEFDQFMIELIKSSTAKEIDRIPVFGDRDALRMPTICFEDIKRFEPHAREALVKNLQRILSIFSALKGRMIQDIHWTNIKNNDVNSAEYNPFQSHGRFVLVLAPETPTPPTE